MMERWVVAVTLGLGVASVVLMWPGRRVREDGEPLDGAGGAGDPPRSTRELLGDLLRWCRRRLRGAAAETRQALELQVLDGLASALDAGLPVDRALAASLAGATQDGAGRAERAAWGQIARAAQDGHALAPAWQRLARRTGSPTVASVARSWRVATLTGAPLAASLRVSAHASRERRRLERAVEVATAGARATVTVLTLLPLAGIVLASVMGVGPVSLYGSPVALAGLATGAVLLGVGHLMVRRMVDRVRQEAL